jgi:hypothetical protein
LSGHNARGVIADTSRLRRPGDWLGALSARRRASDSLDIGQHLPNPIAQHQKGGAVRLAEKAFGEVQPSAGIDRHNPSGRLFLGAVADIGESDPEASLSMGGAESPAVILLDRFGEAEPLGRERGQLATQPGGKIFAKATRVDEMRLHLPMLEQIRLDRDRMTLAPPGSRALNPGRHETREF